MQKSTILDAFATLKPLLVTNQESELDKAVSYLHIKSITKFTTSDTFRVNDSLSRQEAAKLLVLFVKNVM